MAKKKTETSEERALSMVHQIREMRKGDPDVSKDVITLTFLLNRIAALEITLEEMHKALKT